MNPKCLANCGTPILLGLALMLSIGLSQMARATPDNWSVEGEHGELHVHGALTEGACRLDMASVYQEVDVGSTPSALLRKPGNQGTPVTFHLQLRDCLRSGGRQTDKRTGITTWDALQPVVTVSFVAPVVPESPQLIKAAGISGLGLRIVDQDNRAIRPGDRDTPQFTGTASDELVYTVVPERTAAPLTMGAWRATVDFRLNYD